MWHLLKLSWKCLTGNLPIVCSLVSNQTPPRSCKEKGSGVTSPYSSRSMKWPMKSQSSDHWNNAETTSIVHSKWYYEIHYWHRPVYNPTLTITRLCYFHHPKDLDLWHQTSSPRVSWVGSGHETWIPLLHPFGTLPLGLGLGTRLASFPGSPGTWICIAWSAWYLFYVSMT